MIYLLVAIFVYVSFALKNNKIIKTTVGNELIIPMERNKQKISWIAVVVLILFSGLRGHLVGSDLPHYKMIFDLVGKEHNINNTHEHYGFLFNFAVWLSGVISTESIGFTILLMISSIIVVLTAAYVSKECSSDISISMLLFVCFDTYILSFSGLRQSMAIGLIMIAFKYMHDKKPLNFAIMVVLAYYFHDSAIFVLPLYLLNFVNKKNIEYILYAVGVAFIVIYSFVDEIIMEIVCDLLDLHYFYFYGMIGEKLTMMSYLKAFMLIGVFVFFLGYKIYNERKGKTFSRKYTLCLMTYYLAALLNLYNIMTGSFMIISRMIYYFSWTLILLVPEFLASIENPKWKKIFTVLMIVAGICYLSTTVVLRDQFCVTPYRTMFEM